MSDTAISNSSTGASSHIEAAAAVPGFFRRIYSVWYRHYKVYTNNLISNGIPPFLEPLIFLAGIGLGLGGYVGLIGDVPYVVFLASGIVVPPAMFTAAFECSFGTFIRMEFDKVYDGMISSSINVRDLFLGEMLFAGTKSLFFSAAVLIVITILGFISSWTAVFAPIGGFLTGLMFAALSLFITSFVKTINHFNFYFTGLLTPMFFFSGIVFPLDQLPGWLQGVAQIFPLTHSARIVRSFVFNDYDLWLLFDYAYVLLFTLLMGSLAIRRLRKIIVQ
ncbi:ABC transporter permease [Salinispira pacifica]|uniref:Transport permease protein n=1 Tax=Salinispira pacifica TaxID=1307761 RepID=V5WK15_9SPIO|nr:ABC transporter permease [Salinispira pacifica]AHC15934.1 ABC-type multidrug transporter, permease component [Salinispira pacifica]